MSGLFAHCIKLGVFAPVDKIYFMSECDSEDLDQGFHQYSSTADICGKYHWKNWTVDCSRDRDCPGMGGILTAAWMSISDLESA